MRRAIALPALQLLACSLLLGLSCRPASSPAATLQVHATAPASSNDGGICTSPTLAPLAVGTPVTMHFAWAGLDVGEDSVATFAGGLVAYSHQVRPGTYAVRAWASDSGGVGCDTTITVRVLAPPWKPGAVR